MKRYIHTALNSRRFLFPGNPGSLHRSHISHKSSANDEVVLLNSGLTRQEVLSDQAQTGVADVSDIDRSAELLIWIWRSIFSTTQKAEERESSAQQLNNAQFRQHLLERATFGCGCFWCAETVFKQVKGVHVVTSGFAGGHVQSPAYEEVVTGTTGHVEVVDILFDPAVVSYENLLKVFFAAHDPTDPWGQGPDRGPQYRSLILCHSEKQLELSRRAFVDVKALQSDPKGGALVMTQLLLSDALKSEPWVVDDKGLSTGGVSCISQFGSFHAASDNHQNYYEKYENSCTYCSIVIEPKLTHLQHLDHIAELLE
ncbi:hypothetical protein CEUSTIGMA_g10013.t1 [Chlamydomonas eustigma]|uniref:peptide-methionine (S)-S-oxide reductase n=1 Tax=Chlamydomonas eustigma TaxID=1157962 RepID=A0A250XHM6_9CHLO|nr:hypothetical protein CEUSTIGMA_g10013.t1 [Chlamydomonas eustigma]|eukprot:GAX82587.1 hypothetical protein CEUSTIGMA_g10013.t1 [Chlamydomonas eustigma]